jgi:hypothetical protein
MLRAFLFAIALSIVLAVIAKLVVRWKFGGKGRTLRRLTPHGAVEYGTLVAVMSLALLFTLANRLEDGFGLWSALALALTIPVGLAVYAVFLTHVFWTHEGLGAWDPIRKQRWLPWSRVVETGFSKLTQSHFVGDGATRIAFSRFRSGLPELLAFQRGWTKAARP